MDTTSESIAAESVESGDDLVPQIITDEFFEDVANKTHIVWFSFANCFLLV